VHGRPSDAIDVDNTGVLQNGKVLRNRLSTDLKPMDLDQSNDELKECLAVAGNEFIDDGEPHRISESLENDVHSSLLATFWLPVNPDKLDPCPATLSAISFPVG